MIMEIILLKGDGNKGKTSTINLVYDKFLTEGAVELEHKSQVGGDPNDFECFLSFNGHKIALCSMGDYARVVIDYFKTFEQKGADYLICVCNSHFTTPFDVIQKYKHQIISKTTFEEVNKMDANKILASFNLSI
jgi:hypothetical protein